MCKWPGEFFGTAEQPVLALWAGGPERPTAAFAAPADLEALLASAWTSQHLIAALYDSDGQLVLGPAAPAGSVALTSAETRLPFLVRLAFAPGAKVEGAAESRRATLIVGLLFMFALMLAAAYGLMRATTKVFCVHREINWYNSPSEHMHNLRPLLIVTLLATAPVIQPLRGNTISTFTFSGMTYDGGVVSGTLAVDVTQGFFESANVTLLSGGLTTVFSGDPVAQAYDSIDSHLWVVEYGVGGLPPSFPDNPVFLEFAIPFASPVGYQGGAIAPVIGTFVSPSLISDEDFSVATLTLQSPTPEPGTADLLFIGLAALAIASGRRLSAKRPISARATERNVGGAAGLWA